MVYIAVVQLVIILVLVAALVARERDHEAVLHKASMVDVEERRELLNRIQRPQMVVTGSGVTTPSAHPARDAGALAAVGTIARPPADAS